MSEWASKLPVGLLEAFQAAAFEATAHVQHHGGPVIVEVKFFRQDKDSPVEAKVRLSEKEWRV